MKAPVKKSPLTLDEHDARKALDMLREAKEKANRCSKEWWLIQEAIIHHVHYIVWVLGKSLNGLHD